MRNRINNILIGLLWLLAATLGISFWFNTMFGFNIFSVQHWQYIAYMQATGQPVKPLFYISMVVAVLITLFVLFRLLQPRYRSITLPIKDEKNTVTQVTVAPVVQPQPVPETAPVQPVAQQQNTVGAPQMVRPPRLNIPTVTRTTPIPRVPLSDTPQPRVDPEKEYADIRNIFESAGYVYKGMPKIKGVQTATIAIGTGEVLWIGAVGVKNTDMQNAVQTLAGVFSDTLDDIEININAFVVAAPDASAAPNNILQFATVDELREYISRKPNTSPDADEAENFDAYSGYIGTVVDYIGKL